MKFKLYIPFLLFYCIFPVYGLETTSIRSISDLTANVSEFGKLHPQEKVYLHFDNTAYYLGENLWFKAYVVQSDRNSLSNLSKTLYVEMISPEGIIVETRKLKIEDGRCHGEFYLRDSLKPGFYEIRAYTRHMLNEGKDCLFSRVFPFYGKPEKSGDYKKRDIEGRAYSQRVPGQRKDFTQKEKLQLTFYPEGGNLVYGLQSKVAFQAFGKDGDDAEVVGVVCSESGDTVSRFSTSHLNMGSFIFTPESGKYKAIVSYKNREYKFDLPNIQSEGYVMRIDTSEQDKLTILVQKSKGLISEPLGINITCRGRLYGCDSLTIGEENIVSLSFPKKMLPSGVSQVTLFNKKGEILSERMVFTDHYSRMKIEVEPDRKSYKPFEKVTMDFKISDFRDNALETDFSVSVRDASTTSLDPYSGNILTDLLLSSELKGFIESPGYYFTDNDQQKKQDLDLLLLTQGWCSYNWKQMSSVEAYKEKYPFEESLMIEGNVFSLFNKKKSKENVDVLMVLMYGDLSQHGSCKTDKDGRFNLALADFYGKSNLILRTKEKGKRKEMVIMLDRAFSPDLKTYSFYEKLIPLLDSPTVPVIAGNIAKVVSDTINEKQMKSLNDKKNIMLHEVVIKGKKDRNYESEGLNGANIVYDIKKEIDNRIDKGLWEVANLTNFIYDSNKYYSIFASDNGSLQKYKGRNIVCVINNNFAGFGLPEDLSINDVKTVTINETPGVSLRYCQVADGNEVVFFIYTVFDHKIPAGIRKTTFQGYSQVKEFFSPQYDKIVLPDDVDYRRTLYWNPSVRTNKEGKATISFYNNSSCDKMNVCAETVTQNGIIGSVCR
jgi:hypothetical protein